MTEQKIHLSEIQQKIVTARESKILVYSGAGAGKTRCLTERLKFLLNSGVDPNHIVAITFTNAAAEEISERLGHPEGIFIGTIHSLANYYLLSGGIETADILQDEQFNKLFKRVKQNPECLRYVEHLLLDEGQDSTPEQFEFAINLIQPKNWMIFADIRQSIYRWAGAYPDYILDLMKNPSVTIYKLEENYRCAKKILKYAKGIIHLNGLEFDDYSTAMRDVDGKVIEVTFSAPALVRTIKKYGHYKDWFILTRTNDQLDYMVKELTKQDVPCDTFKRAQLDNKELNKRMADDKVKVLTIHTAKGLEAKYVIVIGARFFNVEEKCISYVAATRAKDLLVWTIQRQTGKSPKLTTDNWES